MKLTTEQFEQKLKEGFTGIMDFYAEWCSPCKAMAPTLEQIDTNAGGGIIYKIDIDQERELAKKYEIRSIPTLIFFKNGEQVNKIIGAANKKSIMEALNS